MVVTCHDVAMAKRHLLIDPGALLQHGERQREGEGSDDGDDAERRDGGG